MKDPPEGVVLHHGEETVTVRFVPLDLRGVAPVAHQRFDAEAIEPVVDVDLEAGAPKRRGVARRDIADRHMGIHAHVFGPSRKSGVEDAAAADEGRPRAIGLEQRGHPALQSFNRHGRASARIACPSL